jgi:hypothetical protein
MNAIKTIANLAVQRASRRISDAPFVGGCVERQDL